MRQDKKVFFTLRIASLSKLKKIADVEHRTVSGLIRHIIEEYLEKHEVE